MPTEPFLRIELQNRQPVDLLDLTASLSALGRAYEDFVVSQGFDPLPGNVRLYIKELRSGSIIADLKAMLDQASLVIDHPQLFALFVNNIDALIKFFLFFSPENAKAPSPPRVEADRVNQILEPIAKDGGSILILQVQGDYHHHAPRIEYNSEQANAVQNRIRRYYGPRIPGSQNFREELLTLHQVRDDPKKSVGDRGVIEKFSRRPVRLLFTNEEAKRRVLEQEANPFRKVFLVDGEVLTANGEKPAVYKISYVHGAFDKDELG